MPSVFEVSPLPRLPWVVKTTCDHRPVTFLSSCTSHLLPEAEQDPWEDRQATGSKHSHLGTQSPGLREPRLSLLFPTGLWACEPCFTCSAYLRSKACCPPSTGRGDWAPSCPSMCSRTSRGDTVGWNAPLIHQDRGTAEGMWRQRDAAPIPSPRVTRAGEAQTPLNIIHSAPKGFPRGGAVCALPSCMSLAPHSLNCLLHHSPLILQLPNLMAVKHVKDASAGPQWAWESELDPFWALLKSKFNSCPLLWGSGGLGSSLPLAGLPSRNRSGDKDRPAPAKGHTM